jgi:hypothetical protein
MPHCCCTSFRAAATMGRTVPERSSTTITACVPSFSITIVFA